MRQRHAADTIFSAKPRRVLDVAPPPDCVTTSSSSASRERPIGAGARPERAVRTRPVAAVGMSTEGTDARAARAPWGTVIGDHHLSDVAQTGWGRGPALAAEWAGVGELALSALLWRYR